MKPQQNIPPRFAHWLLHSFLRRDLAEDVTGDLQEQFDYDLETKSVFQAKFAYWRQVLNYLRPFAIRKSLPQHSNPLPMYKSYIRTALRNMIKSKMHSFINIAGLCVGLSVAIIIGLWITDELSYEKNFDNYETVAQVIQNVTNNGEVDTWQNIPWPLAEELRKNYGADFRHIAMGTHLYEHMLATETHKLSKEGVFVEPGFTSIFNLHMISGTRDAIKDPTALLISASTAKTYFGDADPIGQVMSLDGNLNTKVAGVYEDIPRTSRFHELHFVAAWELLFSNSPWISKMEDPWRPNSFALYVQLADNATFEGASERIKDAKLKRVSEALAKKKPALFLHPMRDWHLRSEFKNGVLIGGRIKYVWLFGIVGTFVLLMACINFMNLSTARSEKRAKEVGIRKAIGSLRGQLIAQFFSESILTTFFSLILALVLVHLMLPWFNTIADKQMSLPWSNPTLWVGGVGLSLFIGLIAGSYPALYLSSIKSGLALKGAFKAGRSASLPRKILVVVQFTVSVTLIIGTTIVFLQIKHAQNRPIGYTTSGLLTVPMRFDEVHKHFDAVKKTLLDEGAIINMAEASSPTTESWSSSSRFEWRGKDPDLSVDFSTSGASVDYGKTIGWEIVAGRDFSRDFPADSSSMILNQAAVKYMELKDPIGETIRWGDDALTVVGVVKDIVTRSPYEPVRPTIYFMQSDVGGTLILRLNPAKNVKDALASIEAIVRKHHGERPYSYQFTDQQYALKFDNEERIGTLASVFASLAIFISSLGIFGLSSFMAEQRTKEIGVRKVLGASLYDLWRLMSNDFIVLVILSCIIAVPISYLVLNNWLESYEYHTDLPAWTFIAAAAGTLVITLLTVSWHTLHAASANPVKSLRSE